MAFKFTSSTWDLSGERDLGGNIKLLNPTLSIDHVVVKDGTAYIKFSATENGGLYKHNFTLQVEEPTTADINKLVESVMKDTFDV